MTIERSISLFGKVIQRKKLKIRNIDTYKVRQAGPFPYRRVIVSSNDSILTWGMDKSKVNYSRIDRFQKDEINQTPLLKSGKIWRREYRHVPTK